MELPVLDAREQRVLGSLLEKQVTVPATYPMTINALRSACNQTSSRDPLADYGVPEIDQCLRALAKRDLVRFSFSPGSRAVKYGQALDRALNIDAGERALLTVLLLRGAQAPGELRTRTERLHPFTDRLAVEATLHALAERKLVRELELRPREQDRRWLHLLGPVVVAETEADVYADARGGEPSPFDAWLLGRIADAASGPIVDVGAGPGHAAAFLASSEVADFRALSRPGTAPGWAAITAWYALADVTEPELPAAISALGSTLMSGGTLALAVLVGPGARHLGGSLGHATDVDPVLHDPGAVKAAVATAGLEVTEWYVRSPLPGDVWDAPTLYVIARRPEARP